MTNSKTIVFTHKGKKLIFQRDSVSIEKPNAPVSPPLECNQIEVKANISPQQ